LCCRVTKSGGLRIARGCRLYQVPTVITFTNKRSKNSPVKVLIHRSAADVLHCVSHCAYKMFLWCIMFNEHPQIVRAPKRIVRELEGILRAHSSIWWIQRNCTYTAFTNFSLRFDTETKIFCALFLLIEVR
jgi:hypothetical protein